MGGVLQHLEAFSGLMARCLGSGMEPARALELCGSRPVNHWSLTTLREKLIEIGEKVVMHARYVTSQMAEAVPRELFAAILDRIRRFGVPSPSVQRG